jgi:hypothetical protein
MAKDNNWFVSSSGSGLSATLGGLAGLGGTAVADSIGAIEAISNGIVTILNAVGVSINPELLSSGLIVVLNVLFGAYFVYGASRKLKNKVI